MREKKTTEAEDESEEAYKSDVRNDSCRMTVDNAEEDDDDVRV